MDHTINLIQLALDASLMRQTAIAQNVANSSSTGYQSIDVSFEQQFEQMTELNAEPQELSAPTYILSAHQSTLDEQMVLNVQNMTRYRALIQGLNQKLAIMKLALQGNNQS